MAPSQDTYDKASLKPVIEEVIRTKHCGASLTLLLDKIHVVVADTKSVDDDAYRVWLSDGSKVIQGVLMPDLHPFITAGEISEGSLIILKKYELVKATRRQGRGWIWVIVILDMDVNGHDGRANALVALEDRSQIEAEAEKVEEIAKRSSEVKQQDDSNKKRKRSLDYESSPERKRRFQSYSHSPSPFKPKVRSILAETNMNKILDTPSKSTKFSSILDLGSPSRSLPWLEQPEEDAG